jgi:hypothetical protein
MHANYFLFPYLFILLSDIHQLNLIMEILGTPNDEFMKKISSESVSSLSFNFCNAINFYQLIITLNNVSTHFLRIILKNFFHLFPFF